MKRREMTIINFFLRVAFLKILPQALSLVCHSIKMIYHHHDHYHLQIQQYSLSSKHFVTAAGSYKVLTINKTELVKRIITH